MVLVQAAFAGANIMYKFAVNNKMDLTILVAYRFIFAATITAPLALIFERTERTPITWQTLLYAFFCGLFGGSLLQNVYVESMALTTATFTTAITNLGPAFTFVLAVLFKQEQLMIGTQAGKGKVVGTLLGIGGAMVLTFYKGVNLWSTSISLLHQSPEPDHSSASSRSQVLGPLLALSSCICYSVWLIIQKKMSQSYPHQLSSTALMMSMASVQSIIYSLCRSRHWDQWKLDWDIRLLTVSFSGVVASGVAYTLISWCVRTQGPLFVSAFTPLMLIIVAVLSSLLLEEKLCVGSILGSAIIVCGLYIVLWAKRKETRAATNQLTDQSHDGGSNEVVVQGQENKPDGTGARVKM